MSQASGIDPRTGKKLRYSGTIPVIQKAYENDPRNKLAQAMITSGSDVSPTAGGSYAWGDGLARVAQALGGALMQKSQNKKYAQDENQYVADNQWANGVTPRGATPAMPQEQTQGNPVPVAGGGDGLQAAAAALAPQAFPNGPAPSGPSPAFAAAFPSGPTPSAPTPAPAPAPTPQLAAAPPPQRGMMGTPPPPIAGAKPMNGAMLYRTGIRPIEGGTDPKTGAFRTSPKGAIGPGQVMPATAPEAARLAGVPFDDHLYRTDAAYNDKLGEAYYSHQLAKFGDPVKAAAAYNGGASRVTRAIRLAQAKGGSWEDYIRAPETRNYMAKFKAKIGGAVQADPGVTAAPPQMEAVPEAVQMPNEAPVAPRLPDAVKSQRLEVAKRMLATGNPAMMEIAQQYLDKGMAEEQEGLVVRNNQEYQQGDRGYTAELNDYTATRDDARSAQNADHVSAQTRNFARETQAAEAVQKALDRQAAAALNDADNKAITDRPGRTPVFAAKQYFTNTSSLGLIQRTKAAIEARPNSVGFDKGLNEAAIQRLDPEGVAVRSMITDLMTDILHNRSGAAVTPEEYARIVSYIPKIHDTPATIGTKLDMMAKTLSDENGVLKGMYPNDPMFSSSPAPTAPAAPGLGTPGYAPQGGAPAAAPQVKVSGW